MKKMNVWLSTLGFLLVSSAASATQWQINNSESQINFISTKKVNIAEVHQFDKIAAAKPKEQTNQAAVKTTRKQNGTQRKKPAASTELIKKMPELKVVPAPKLRNRK